MPKEYYFISDLHIGGDEVLGECDFEEELITFLNQISTQSSDTELVIIGDAFGLWEFTNVEGIEKIETLFAQFPSIFNAFRETGENMKITILPGNHDYELACYSEFINLFRKYNIHIEQTRSIMRKIAGKSLWIEHGNQYDDINHMPDFGNPYALPVGYFITKNTVAKAGIISGKGRANWLKDIQSVYPTELIPDWIMSNYFYKEMSPVLRWMLLPFLLLSGLTIFVLAGTALEYLNITDENIFLNNQLFDSLFIFGSIFQIILSINAIVFLIFLALVIPFSIVIRDLKSTLKRFGIELDPKELTGEKEGLYLDAAKNIFNIDPEIIAFIYGHTHKPSLEQIEDKYVINTGTWLKQFNRVKPRFGFLPAIYVPFFCLNYFRIKENNHTITIEYIKLEKSFSTDLTLIQRLLVSRRRKNNKIEITKKITFKI